MEDSPISKEATALILGANSVTDLDKDFLSAMVNKMIAEDHLTLVYDPDTMRMELFAYYEYAFFDYETESDTLVKVIGEDILTFLKAMALCHESGWAAYMVYKARRRPVFDIDECLRHGGWDYENIWHAAVRNVPITDMFTKP